MIEYWIIAFLAGYVVCDLYQRYFPKRLWCKIFEHDWMETRSPTLGDYDTCARNCGTIKKYHRVKVTGGIDFIPVKCTITKEGIEFDD